MASLCEPLGSGCRWGISLILRSDAEEQGNIEVRMRERDLGWILRELAGDRQILSKSVAMDMDESARANVPKTGTIVPGSGVQPKCTIDLESMAFS